MLHGPSQDHLRITHARLGWVETQSPQRTLSSKPPRSLRTLRFVFLACGSRILSAHSASGLVCSHCLVFRIFDAGPGLREVCRLYRFCVRSRRRSGGGGGWKILAMQLESAICWPSATPPPYLPLLELDRNESASRFAEMGPGSGTDVPAGPNRMDRWLGGGTRPTRAGGGGDG